MPNAPDDNDIEQIPARMPKKERGASRNEKLCTSIEDNLYFLVPTPSHMMFGVVESCKLSDKLTSTVT
ncbi:hypothetical protein Hypma_016137 [Hypsizygus marmoreus]|uniref:Uncharacterized protein n=1 Tax=Hypsizygus marmoreus TaxID=39966 RepID=A0A369J1J4_HYPMA|nr:hypothetical protein Hypma_016137 [Hypsizygus marmoreus]